ncbi:lipopolysaccharide transport periplasmic protein LptA [Desulfurivibrio alkaliphilus]|uniref:Lipopolysaccharide transport periplasmic protein LptA n=1 Tax=Desulfurivibrio alkaliphilus (strain DSM 19089 / UNIQEM U267 / AHT2) TaxID=589865 RepID=D6Z6A8_DESAT|nr:lipopolysaccharide transport periplasmic protein LptA [Desulfurivibrio alkaliphilus]ADH86873.1 lipopolysaccharide transport periplasmic protein LptA [Desulfurivibrio alkaliphilus AHT 2]
MRLYLVVCCLGLLLGAGVAVTYAAEGERAEPVRIEADRMETGDEPNSVLFRGQVVARQGDLVIHADTMTIFHLSQEEQDQLPAGDRRRLKKLYATGQVRVEAEDWIGTGDTLEYTEADRKVLLAGKARAWQEGNLITGRSITLYLDEGRSVVERGETPEERVRAFFYADDDQPKPMAPDDESADHTAPPAEQPPGSPANGDQNPPTVAPEAP